MNYFENKAVLELIKCKYVLPRGVLRMSGFGCFHSTVAGKINVKRVILHLSYHQEINIRLIKNEVCKVTAVLSNSK